MKKSKLSKACLADFEQVVHNQISFGNVYIDTENQNQWYCPLSKDVCYIPEQDFLWKKMMFVHNHNFRAYLENSFDSDELNVKKEELQDAIRNFTVDLYNKVSKVCLLKCFNTHEHKEKLSVTEQSQYDEAEQQLINLLKDEVNTQFSQFFDPEYYDLANPWMLVRGVEYSNYLTANNIPGQMSVRINYHPGMSVLIYIFFKEKQPDKDGKIRVWSMLIRYNKNQNSLEFFSDTPTFSLYEPYDNTEEMTRLLKGQVWTAFGDNEDYGQTIIPQNEKNPNVIEELRHYIQKKSKEIPQPITIKEINIPSKSGISQAALIVARSSAIAQLIDD